MPSRFSYYLSLNSNGCARWFRGNVGLLFTPKTCRGRYCRMLHIEWYCTLWHVGNTGGTGRGTREVVEC